MLTQSYNKVGFPLGVPAFNLPIGTIIDSPYSISDPAWLRCDGTPVNRGQYPALSAQLQGVGIFTPTIRTMVTTPNSAALAISTNGANIIAAGVAGTTGIQTSSNNGVTWASATTPSSSAVYAAGLVNTGTNMFALSGVNSGMVSPTGTGTGTWTACSGLSNSPSSCASNGAGMVIAPSGATYSISTNNGSTFTSASSVAAGTASSGAAIVWSGTQWIIFCATATTGVGLQTSPTGLTGTWTAALSPPWGSQVISAAATDGVSNVLAVTANSSVAWVSNNGGTTWRPSLLPANSLGSCSYANGRWFVPLLGTQTTSPYSDGTTAASGDLYSWTLIPPMYFPNTTSGATLTNIVYIGGNYCAVNILGTTTSTENTSQMYLPMSRRSAMTAGQQIQAVTNWQEWIKVQ